MQQTEQEETGEAPLQIRSFSISQLATRWGVGKQRIKQLIDSGKLPGAFVIPSAGKYEKTIRITAETVSVIESEWSVVPGRSVYFTRKKKSTVSDSLPLTHFPEIAAKLDSGSPLSDPD